MFPFLVYALLSFAALRDRPVVRAEDRRPPEIPSLYGVCTYELELGSS